MVAQRCTLFPGVPSWFPDGRRTTAQEFEARRSCAPLGVGRRGGSALRCARPIAWAASRAWEEGRRRSQALGLVAVCERLALGPSQTCEASRRPVSWRIRGTYFESCNCDAVCPCRRIDGVSGGRSTHGVCRGVLSWVIEDGVAGGTDLSGLPVALASRGSDDEPGSPWTYVLYLDAGASGEQRAVLEDIFTGRLEGDALRHFPWAWKESELLAVWPAAIEVDHTPRRQWLRVRDHVTVRIRDRHDGGATVTCVIPGHERPGEELVADDLRVADGRLAFEYHGLVRIRLDVRLRRLSCAVVDPGRAAVENPRRRPRGCSMSWNVKGSYVETCSCELMCPCNLSFDHGATYDFCRVDARLRHPRGRGRRHRHRRAERWW